MSIPASSADAVNPSEIKTLLANGLITFFFKVNPIFTNGPTSLPRNPPSYINLDNWIFDSIISADELFATCLSVNNNLCGKLVSSSELPFLFDDNLKTTSVSFFIEKFDLLSCAFVSFTLKLFYWVML